MNGRRHAHLARIYRSDLRREGLIDCVDGAFGGLKTCLIDSPEGSSLSRCCIVSSAITQAGGTGAGQDPLLQLLNVNRLDHSQKCPPPPNTPASALRFCPQPHPPHSRGAHTGAAKKRVTLVHMPGARSCDGARVQCLAPTTTSVKVRVLRT